MPSVLLKAFLTKCSLETVTAEVFLENIIFSSTTIGDSKANVQNNETVNVTPVDKLKLIFFLFVGQRLQILGKTYQNLPKICESEKKILKKLKT